MDQQLYVISGSGLSHWRKEGLFDVYYLTGSVKFSLLDEAVEYYKTLTEEAAIWDITQGATLLEFKTNIQ